MKVLMIGDVVSQAGCEFLRQKLPTFKREHEIDVVIANGENSAVGNGVLPKSAEFLFQSGVDVLTGGNHSFKRREIYSYLDETEAILRPANYPESCPGHGSYLYDGGSFSLLVVSMLGTSFLEPLEGPFDAMDRILAAREVNPPTFTIVDFHAEATGEKNALGYYLDGRVSAVCGTHTHVQTADERILPKGTAFITDLGMTGPYESALGIRPECVIERLRSHLPTRFEVDDTAPCRLDGLMMVLSRKTGLCESLERVALRG